jgi:Helix-turn-helix domain
VPGPSTSRRSTEPPSISAYYPSDDEPRSYPHDQREGRIATVGLTNDELARRYRAGEPLPQLAVDTGMSVSGVQARLRRIGVPARRQPSKAARLPKDAIAQALDTHGSINAAAKQLGITRAALMAEAHRHGLRHALTVPQDLLDRYQRGATQTELAAHYGVAASTVGMWLQAHGITRRRGRRPIDS